MNKENLIYDEGKLRNCPSNKSKIGYWRTLWHFNGYGKIIKRPDWHNIRQAFITIFYFFAFVVLFPFSPFIAAYCDYTDSKETVKKLKRRTNK